MYIHCIKSRSASSATVNGNTSIPGEKLVSRRKAITLGRYRNCYKENYRRMTLMDTSRPPLPLLRSFRPCQRRPVGRSQPLLLAPALRFNPVYSGRFIGLYAVICYTWCRIRYDRGTRDRRHRRRRCPTPRRPIFNRGEARPSRNGTTGAAQQTRKFQASERADVSESMRADK